MTLPPPIDSAATRALAELDVRRLVTSWIAEDRARGVFDREGRAASHNPEITDA